MESGIICIDKPQGFTSFDVVAKMRGIAGTRRIGHAGTLDPMATGVLPLFFERATKACDLLPVQDKRYTAQFRLGVTTDTLDATGKVLSERPVTAGAAQVRAAAERFTGEYLQVPPMYSAVQVGGRRLYELARAGKEVERAARPVTVKELRFLSCDERAHAYTIDVLCSKGTYIRSLAADIGEALGCGAVLTALRRTMAAGFTEGDCITLETAQALADAGRLGEALLPIGRAFGPLPQARLSEKQARMLQNGVRLDRARVCCPDGDGLMAAHGPDGAFLGLAEARGAEFRLKKLFALPQEPARGETAKEGGGAV